MHSTSKKQRERRELKTRGEWCEGKGARGKARGETLGTGAATTTTNKRTNQKQKNGGRGAQKTTPHPDLSSFSHPFIIPSKPTKTPPPVRHYFDSPSVFRWRIQASKSPKRMCPLLFSNYQKNGGHGAPICPLHLDFLLFECGLNAGGLGRFYATPYVASSAQDIIASLDNHSRPVTTVDHNWPQPIRCLPRQLPNNDSLVYKGAWQ
jgi:hypothetical protein